MNKKSKKCLKIQKYFLVCFKQISKGDTWFYINFLMAFQNIAFRSVALVIKQLWALLDFSYLPETYPVHKKICYKKPSNFNLSIFKNFHIDSLKNKSVRGGGAPNAPPQPVKG